MARPRRARARVGRPEWGEDPVVLPRLKDRRPIDSDRRAPTLRAAVSPPRAAALLPHGFPNRLPDLDMCRGGESVHSCVTSFSVYRFPFPLAPPCLDMASDSAGRCSAECARLRICNR